MGLKLKSPDSGADASTEGCREQLDSWMNDCCFCLNYLKGMLKDSWYVIITNWILNQFYENIIFLKIKNKHIRFMILDMILIKLICVIIRFF